MEGHRHDLPPSLVRGRTQAVSEGIVGRRETALAVVTGSGLKNVRSALGAGGQPAEIPPDDAAIGAYRADPSPQGRFPFASGASIDKRVPMSGFRRTGSGSVVALVAAVHVWSLPLAGTHQGAARLVPSVLEQAARMGTLKQFANELVAAGIPVGIIIGIESSDVYRGWRRPTEAGATEPVGFDNAMQVFRSHNGRYTTRHPGDVLRIEPVEAHHCAIAVERPIGRPFAASGSALDVVFEAFRHATGIGRDAPPPSIVGDEAPRASYRAYVSVDLPGGSLAEILDAVARQAPGLGWAIQETEYPSTFAALPSQAKSSRLRCQVQLLSGDSWLTTGWYIDPSGPQGER